MSVDAVRTPGDVGFKDTGYPFIAFLFFPVAPAGIAVIAIA